MNSREIVLDILLELSKGNEYSNILIAAVLEKYDYLDSREKAFIKRVSEGTIERRIQIDYVLDRYSKVPVRKMKPLIRELLRLSTYQLLFMEHVPDAAVCNEAVKLAKKRKFQSLQGYVNGVLRSIARGKAQIKYPDKQNARTEYLSVCYSMPVWLVEHYTIAYGEDVCEKILQAYLQRQPVSIRLDERMTQEEQETLLSQWKHNGVEAARHSYLPYAVTVQKTDGIRSLEGYESGSFAVQDVSSMLVVEVAGIKAGDTVIDVCAAPGGKALHAAAKLNGTGQVIACDVTEYKTDKIEENRQRLQLPNVSVRVQDARKADQSLVDKADVLIADVPCSGLGVIGKKQDIKYRVTQESLNEIVQLQKEILQNVTGYVKPGGIMMYSTCTMNPAENEKMVQWICSELGFKPESMAPYMPRALQKEAEKGYIQLLPGIHETDGFFLARLRRK
ncbi:MAG: 16S rRNA (cytosine(967)-C(5))-methyltransferase RsmB [Lachnospiraceae bacterium]|nr:16S rRNA (cytosine(967)-C(5))-methyltransferase RsmB [Lachnospiraceae bacterium]